MNSSSINKNYDKSILSPFYCLWNALYSTEAACAELLLAEIDRVFWRISTKNYEIQVPPLTNKQIQNFIEGSIAQLEKSSLNALFCHLSLSKIVDFFRENEPLLGDLPLITKTHQLFRLLVDPDPLQTAIDSLPSLLKTVPDFQKKWEDLEIPLIPTVPSLSRTNSVDLEAAAVIERRDPEPLIQELSLPTRKPGPCLAVPIERRSFPHAEIISLLKTDPAKGKELARDALIFFSGEETERWVLSLARQLRREISPDFTPDALHPALTELSTLIDDPLIKKEIININ